MARIGIGSIAGVGASLVADAAWAFEAKWVKVGGASTNLLADWGLSPSMTLFVAVLIGGATASVGATLLTRR